MYLPSLMHLRRFNGLGRLKKEALQAISYSLGRDQVSPKSHPPRPSHS